MSPALSRRALLGLAPSLMTSLGGCFRPALAGRLWLPETGGTPAAGRISRDQATFAAGVWSGDPTHNSVVIGTRCFAEPGVLSRGLALCVRELGSSDTVQGVRKIQCETTAEGFVYAKVEALRPARRHAYSFATSDGRHSAIGWFATAPEAHESPTVSFVATSCSNVRFGPFASLVHAAHSGPVDFWVHAGDHAYCDGAHGLEALRERYLDHWSTDGLRALHACAAGYSTWDDHEVGNNWTPETTHPQRIAEARRVMLEHNAIGRDGDGREPIRERLWRSFAWGRTLELFVLDTRGERRRRGIATPEYISRAQLQWLIEGVRGSRARFKIIVNPVPIARFEGLFRLAQSDGWLGYSAQREVLLDAIRDVPGVLFLSGDYHVGVSARVERSGPYAHLRELLVGAAGSFMNPATQALVGPQWDFVTTSFSTARITCDPHLDGGTLRAVYLDDGGRAIYDDVIRC
ncbi:MAG: alkaline phosphatase D family protein [Deltaproteobacteria bacterium]|nr:alkaline phosphatase D family protein [Deltaproteobacteria bacterium]